MRPPGLLLFGGVDQRNVKLNDLYSYTPETRVWESLEITDAPPARTNHTAVVHGHVRGAELAKTSERGVESTSQDSEVKPRRRVLGECT